MPIHSSFLKYFDEVCKSGSIRKAAANLHVASSAVNRQILKIEDELGVSLFDRSHKGIKLTEEGRLLSEHISRTLSDADRTLREIGNSQVKSTHNLTLVGQESVISRFLPPVLMDLYAEFPNASTSFMARSGRELRQLLLNGIADIALMFDACDEPGVKLIDQINLPVGAVMDASHPLANQAQLTVGECNAYELILPDDSWPLWDVLSRELDNASIDLEAVITSNSIEFLRSMLAEKKVIGFQTIIGLEAAVTESNLVHIPLLDVNNEHITQTFSIGISENHAASDIFDKTLSLLQKRIRSYSV